MMKLVQLSAAVGIISLSLFSCGNKKEVTPPPTPAEKSIALKIENGTSLTYKVSPSEMVNYSLDITFKELTPKLSFDFVMTNMDYTKGSVELDESVKKSSYAYTDQFVAGKTIYTDKSCMVLSVQAYRDLLEAGKARINWNGEDIEFKTVSNEEYSFEKGNGQIVETVIHCSNESKTKQFWVWKNPELPLIMKTKGSPSMELTYWYLPGEHP